MERETNIMKVNLDSSKRHQANLKTLFLFLAAGAFLTLCTVSASAYSYNFCGITHTNLTNEAIAEAQKTVAEVCEMIEELAAKAGVEKEIILVESDPELYSRIAAEIEPKLIELRQIPDKQQRKTAIKELFGQVTEQYCPAAPAADQTVYNPALIKRILGKNKTRLILTLGSVSATLIDGLDTHGVDVIKLQTWNQPGAKQNWQSALGAIQNKSYPKDIDPPSFAYHGERLQIPRYDLPYGTLKWQGSSGDRARRAKLPDGQWSPDYYKLLMPGWAFELEPLPLTSAEQQAISNHP